METKPFSLQSPEAVAKEYGGNKRAIAQAAQMGVLDPTTAVLAGMFIDRMRNAASAEQAPTQTVAQEVLTQPQMGVPGQAMPQAQMGVPSEGVPSRAAGLDAIEVPEDMYNEDSFAGGGIVAFAAGDSVSSPAGRAWRNWIETQRRSVAESTPGMVGAWNRPLVSPEEDEAMRLRQAVEQKYGGPASLIQGFFTRQSEADRQAAQDIMRRLPKMSIDELRAVAGGTQFTPAPTVAADDSSVEGLAAIPVSKPMTVGDLRRLEAQAGDPYVTGPGLTPAQSEANVAAARPTAPTAPGAAKATGPNVGDIIARSKKMAEGIYPADTAVPVPTTAEAGQQVTDLLKQSGFDPEIFAKQQQQLEAEKATLSEDRKTAVNMRIIEAGLGIMGGESPNAFTNIGKGATPAVQGLAKDIKELKAAERAYDKAQRDLDVKKNDFAVSKAGMTQKVVDKAQDRADAKAKEVTDLQGRLAQTMLAGDIQKEIAKSSYGRMTDFDKQWALYEADAKRRGDVPSLDGFRRALEGSRGTLSYQDAIRTASQQLAGATASEIQAYARELMGGQGGAMGAPARYQEGQEAKDKSGKPIVYRNGQWVYK